MNSIDVIKNPVLLMALRYGEVTEIFPHDKYGDSANFIKRRGDASNGYMDSLTPPVATVIVINSTAWFQLNMTVPRIRRRKGR
jgi:hypothetical protein